MLDQQKFIEQRMADVNNYENLLRALVSLKKYVEENIGGKYYFGGKLLKSGLDPQTPDMIIDFKDTLVIGEAKRSLCNPFPEENKDKYIKRYVEGKIISQLKKYDQTFQNISVDKHDLMLLAPETDNEALGILKFDYLDKNTNTFERKFSIVVYSVSLGANTKTILVKYDYGSMSNDGLFDILRRGIKYYEKQIVNELGRYKIYEENNTPIEYIMLLLWDSIFNEILKTSETDCIIKRYKERESTFEVNLVKLVEYLQKMYVLPTLPSTPALMKENSRMQFKTKVVRDAMDIFCIIGLAKKISEKNEDVLYEVTLKTLPEKNELSYFLKKIHEIQNTGSKPLDPTGIEKLTKYFPENMK
ncbi:MAG TPA: hypothetical protein VEC16_06490 [Alphaproteobacteria bacterium]|nr:hypothetical protein [Alphaproteobacteria bacterium]